MEYVAAALTLSCRTRASSIGPNTASVYGSGACLSCCLHHRLGCSTRPIACSLVSIRTRSHTHAFIVALSPRIWRAFH